MTVYLPQSEHYHEKLQGSLWLSFSSPRMLLSSHSIGQANHSDWPKRSFRMGGRIDYISQRGNDMDRHVSNKTIFKVGFPASVPADATGSEINHTVESFLNSPRCPPLLLNYYGLSHISLTIGHALSQLLILGTYVSWMKRPPIHFYSYLTKLHGRCMWHG